MAMDRIEAEVESSKLTIGTMLQVPPSEFYAETVTPNGAAQKGGLDHYLGWAITHVNNIRVATKEEFSANMGKAEVRLRLENAKEFHMDPTESPEEQVKRLLAKLSIEEELEKRLEELKRETKDQKQEHSQLKKVKKQTESSRVGTLANFVNFSSATQLYTAQQMENGEFSSSKKLEEVKCLYKSKLPALSKEEGIGDTMSVGTATSNASFLGGKRWCYSELAHQDTNSNLLRKNWMDKQQQSKAEIDVKERKKNLLHKHRLSTVPSKNQVTAEDLLREIQKWTRKLENCKTELDHRRREYYHVLLGGDPLDSSHEEEFDSDVEHDYSDQHRLFIEDGVTADCNTDFEPSVPAID